MVTKNKAIVKIVKNSLIIFTPDLNEVYVGKKNKNK